MTKVTLSDLTSLTNETSAVDVINNNSAALETAIENTLSRDGTTPNIMGALLDMNSNRIINLPRPVSDEEPVRMGDLDLIGSLALTSTSFATRSVAESSMIPVTQYTIITGGYNTIGDRGHATYTRTNSLTTGGFQSADGAYWKLAPVDGAVNILQFGADPSGINDSRSAWDAFISADFSKKKLPSGVYTSSTGFPLSSKNGLHITGDGWANTTLQRSTDGDVLPIVDSNYITLEEFYIGRKPGNTYTTGGGLKATGSSSSIEIRHVRSNGHPRSGFAWIGTSLVQQSENALLNCEAMSNLYAGLEAVWSNDFSVSENGFGDPNAGWNSTYGAIITDCGQVGYESNRHWGHQVGARFVNAQTPRFSACNRVEESATNGLEFVNCVSPTIVGNVCHTNSESSLGTYYHIVLDGCFNSVVVGNTGMSWNVSSYRTNYFLRTLNTGSITLIGNDCSDAVNGMYNLSSGTSRTIFDSSGSTITGLGATTDYLDVRNNYNNSAFAGIARQNWIGNVSSPVATELFQRSGSSSGGQYTLQLNDSSGVSRNRKIVTADGRHYFSSSATFTGATATIADSNNASISRTSAGVYVLTATTGTLPTNSHVTLGYLSNSAFFISRVTARTTTTVNFEFQSWNGTTFVAADPTTVWVDVY